MTTPLALLVAVIAQLLLGSSGAGAQLLPESVADGDVFASVGKSTVEWRHADTSPKGSMTAVASTPWTTGVAYRADTGSLYVAGNNAINVFDANGAWTGTFGSGYNSQPGGIVFDGAGNAYVPLSGGSRQILKLGPGGQLLRAFSPALDGNAGPARVDVGPDGCTLLYTTSGTSIKRFDACTSTQLPDLATNLPGLAAGEVRALPDGGALVADWGSILRVGQDGTLVATFDLPDRNCWAGLAMDLSWAGFWAGDVCSGSVHRFSVTNGSSDLAFGVTTGGRSIGGLAVAGGVTAAQDAEASGQSATKYIGPEGGEVTTDTGTGATPDDPAYGRMVFPAGPGGFASIVEEAEFITPCTVNDCVGIAIDYIVPPGYNDPDHPIRVFLVYDASLLEEGTTDLTIWVEKPVLGQMFFSVVPDCSDLVGADAVTGCVADQTVDPATGDIETEIWMISDDPMYQG